jgi:hypothetical protein
MPHLVERLPYMITVRGSTFMLMDLEGANGQPEGAEDLWELGDRVSRTNWFLATANVAIITSHADSWHTAEVTLELWDGRPPGDDDEWSRNKTTDFYSSSGKLQVAGVEGHASGKVMDLRDQGCHWSVRTSVRPGPCIRYHEDRPPEGLETYRIQFWPVDT